MDNNPVALNDVLGLSAGWPDRKPRHKWTGLKSNWGRKTLGFLGKIWRCIEKIGTAVGGFFGDLGGKLGNFVRNGVRIISNAAEDAAHMFKNSGSGMKSAFRDFDPLEAIKNVTRSIGAFTRLFTGKYGLNKRPGSGMVPRWITINISDSGQNTNVIQRHQHTFTTTSIFGILNAGFNFPETVTTVGATMGYAGNQITGILGTRMTFNPNRDPDTYTFTGVGRFNSRTLGAFRTNTVRFRKLNSNNNRYTMRVDKTPAVNTGLQPWQDNWNYNIQIRILESMPYGTTPGTIKRPWWHDWWYW